MSTKKPVEIEVFSDFVCRTPTPPHSIQRRALIRVSVVPFHEPLAVPSAP